MITFQSNKKNTFFTVFKSWAIALFPIAIFCIIQYYFHLFNANPSIIPAASIFILLKIFYDGLTETRINKINVDAENKSISLQYYNLYDGQHQKEFPFSDVRIKIKKTKRKWWNAAPVVNLMVKKGENFSVTRYKDGFSVKTLDALIEMLESLTVEIN